MRWRWHTYPVIALVAFSTTGTAALAQTQAQPAPVAPPLSPRIGVADTPLPITLADAVRMTLEQNNDVSIAKLDVDDAREGVRAAEGVYDPRVTPNFGYQRNVSANTSAIGGATEGRLERTEIDGGAGMVGRTPWAGGRFTIDFSASRLDTSNQFARLNPEFPSALTGTYVQPLLRGRSIDLERRNILLARRALDLTDAQLTQVIMDQLTLVEEAYWDLAYAARNLDVLNNALGQARAQVESNGRQVSQGTLAPIDVVEAQTQVSRFEQAVASGQQSLTSAENRLKRLILANRTAQAWNQPLVPADLSDRSAPPIVLAEAVKLALARRPELRALDISRAQNEIDRTFFQNQTKPQLNVVGGYTLSGLSGDPLTSTTEPPVGNTSDNALYARLNELSLIANLDAIDPPTSGGTAAVPDFFVGGLGRSLGNLFAHRFPTAVVQLQMDLPLRNRTARANLARSEIAGTQLERQRQQLEQVIESEVRDALQAVRSSEQRFDAASSQRRYALEQYESERRRFDSGLSTVFLVLERQTTYVTSQALELRARADLNQAIAQLERAIGGTLEWHGVRIQP
jgi:outer membrane protein TolC